MSSKRSTKPAGRRTGLPSKAATSKGGVAPSLRTLVACGSGWKQGGDTDERAAAELRALLAVAKSAERSHRDHPTTCGGCREKMARALARLRRVSSRGTGR